MIWEMVNDSSCHHRTNCHLKLPNPKPKPKPNPKPDPPQNLEKSSSSDHGFVFCVCECIVQVYINACLQTARRDEKIRNTRVCVYCVLWMIFRWLCFDISVHSTLHTLQSTIYTPPFLTHLKTHNSKLKTQTSRLKIHDSRLKRTRFKCTMHLRQVFPFSILIPTRSSFFHISYNHTCSHRR